MTDTHPCPQCGAATNPAFKARDFNRRIGVARFAYLRCTRCGVIFLRDVPADLARYYANDYYVIPHSVAQLAAWSVSERYKIELVRRFRGAGRLIEIGPASGGFCYLAKAAGFEVQAIEMDHRCCAFLSSKLGIVVVESADEATALEEMRPADVIVMWHVIEHLVSPWSMLEVAARKLLPGGVLVVAAPNPHAFQFGVLGERWAHVDAPRHLWLIPPGVIAERGARSGLELRMITTRDRGSLAWNRFGWEYTLMNRFSNGAVRRVGKTLGRAIAAAAYPLESQEGRGAAYTVVLQRNGP